MARALTVLRETVASGVDHIDTSSFYGPHVTNRPIAEALAPFRPNLTLVTKAAAVHGADASCYPAIHN